MDLSLIEFGEDLLAVLGPDIFGSGGAEAAGSNLDAARQMGLVSTPDRLGEALETTSLQPRRIDVSVRLVALAWAPLRNAPDGSVTALWK